MSKSRERIFVLNNPHAPRINTLLANEIGFEESIVLLQIEYWISISDNIVDDKKWTYQSTTEMNEKSFSFWSIAKINRIIKSLESMNLIEIGNHNKRKYDKTRWFSLNTHEINKLKSITIEGYESEEIASNQNDLDSSENVGKSTVSPEGSNQNELRSEDKIDTGIDRAGNQIDLTKNQYEQRSAQNEPRSNQNEPRSAQYEPTIPEITTESTTDTTTEKKEPHNSESDEGDPPEDPVMRKEITYLVDKLIDRIKINHPRQPLPLKKSKQYRNWCEHMDKLNRIGPPGGKVGYGYLEIFAIIKWCQLDDFWKNNIMSSQKLREKVVKLEAAMNSKGGGSSGASHKQRYGKSPESIRLEKEAGRYGDVEIIVPECNF